jgi:hypothetical protein
MLLAREVPVEGGDTSFLIRYRPKRHIWRNP